VQVRVSGLSRLADGEALVFPFERDGERREGFVLRRDDDYFAYHNRCPHWGVDLDMGERRFYSSLSHMIFCSSHGALFDVASGYCVVGPCVGSSLETFELALDRDGDAAVVTIADIDPDPRY
jgi:nitrite reductase/ring-hydroxylating ferredoxin subunit